MTDQTNSTQKTDPAPMLPWVVVVSPEYYDDKDDTGYTWEGRARTEDEAVRLALTECFTLNGREEPEIDEDGVIDAEMAAAKAYDLDPENAKLHLAEVDFRQIAIDIAARHTLDGQILPHMDEFFVAIQATPAIRREVERTVQELKAA